MMTEKMLIKRPAFTFVLCLLLSGCSSEFSPVPNAAPKKAYVLPAEFSINPVAERGPEGEIYISGTTNFPDGMKMWIEYELGRGKLGPLKGQQDAFVTGGRFRSGPIYPVGPVLASGKQRFEITAYFNGAWQNESVLSILGEGGKKVSGTLFKLTDPDVIDSDKILDAWFTLSLPPAAPEADAINTVKHAILTVPGWGRSATDIKENIKLFESPGTGVKPGKGWSASPAEAGVYNVAYDFINGNAGHEQAIWSVNTATKRVKYVNGAAKAFSWTPKD